MEKNISLYVVPTPIGNLKDITIRALEILKEVDEILVEDTRTSKKFLNHWDIEKPLISYHAFNEHRTIENIISKLKSGIVMALISDAGTPAISDPGYLLVHHTLQNNLKVCTLPGPTALIPALVQSGFPCDKFVYEGFLPHKKGRNTRLKILSEETRTIVMYESPHRIIKTLEQLKEFFGENRQVSVSRELSKIYEETINGTPQELIQYFSKQNIKGEFVIVVTGKK